MEWRNKKGGKRADKTKHKMKDRPEPRNKVTHEPKEAKGDKVKNYEVFSSDPK